MARLFDNRIPERLLEGSLGCRRPTGKPRNTWGNKCGLRFQNFTWRTVARRMTGLRNGTGGENMDRTQAEEPYECPLEQSTFTEYLNVSDYPLLRAVVSLPTVYGFLK
jgi:hypothetical protein